jgi:hypothetical protein
MHHPMENLHPSLQMRLDPPLGNICQKTFYFILLCKDLLIKKVSTFDGNANYEAWIYSVGALKLLSGNSVVRKTIVNSGCIEALGIILRNVIKQVNY